MKGIVIYDNNESNSKYHTRPFNREYAKETDEYMAKVTKELDDQIDNLTDSQLKIGEENVINVKHKVIPSMNDGITLSAISTRILRESTPGRKMLATTSCSSA